MIKYAILGILSARPQTGYELKKTFAGSAVLHWSGNNNQIYTTLSDLLKDGLVTKEVQAQERLPAKSIYTITEQGLAVLKEWTLSQPDPPEYRSAFWVRLISAGQLSADELGQLLDQYEQEVRTQLLMQREVARRGHVIPVKTPRDAQLQDLIMEGIAGFYERELDWIDRVRKSLVTDER